MKALKRKNFIVDFYNFCNEKKGGGGNRTKATCTKITLQSYYTFYIDSDVKACIKV